MKLRKFWRDMSDLSMYDAALIMIGTNPDIRNLDELLERTESNERSDKFFQDAITEKCMLIQSACDDKKIPITREDRDDSGQISAATTRIQKDSWLSWLRKLGDYPAVIAAFDTEETELSAPPAELNETLSSSSGEPSLRKGKNSRDAVQKWVTFQATALKKTGDTTALLAERIELLAAKHGYESERGKITETSIERMLPSGITGGRGKNRGQSKNQKPLDIRKTGNNPKK